MFNNDLMADVHFVVGPPGGTQRLPGHKVSNSCITVLVLQRGTLSVSLKLSVGSLPPPGSMCFTQLQRKHICPRGFGHTEFFFVSYLPPKYACPLISVVLGSCCGRLEKSDIYLSPTNQLDKLLFISQWGGWPVISQIFKIISRETFMWCFPVRIPCTLAFSDNSFGIPSPTKPDCSELFFWIDLQKTHSI